MTTTISNSNLTAQIKHLGAELFSLKNNQNKEFIWEGNQEFWGKHSPILFPIVGTLKNNSYSIPDFPNFYKFIAGKITKEKYTKKIYKNYIQNNKTFKFFVLVILFIIYQ